MIWKCPSCHPHQCEKTHRQPRLFLGHWIINSFEFLAKRRPKKISFSIFTDENPMRKSNLYLNRKSFQIFRTQFDGLLYREMEGRHHTRPWDTLRRFCCCLDLNIWNILQFFWISLKIKFWHTNLPTLTQ